jgi:hypothetical protein
MSVKAAKESMIRDTLKGFRGRRMNTNKGYGHINIHMRADENHSGPCSALAKSRTTKRKVVMANPTPRATRKRFIPAIVAQINRAGNIG